MSKFLASERFGQPQLIAAGLLLMFLGQCCWLLVRGTGPLDVDSSQLFRVQEGLRQWRGEGVAGTPSPQRAEAATPPSAEIEQNDGYDPYHSALWYLIASAGLLEWQGTTQMNSVAHWGWLVRLPYLMFGVLLGASLWYVARRLYGNPGGYTALALYCFSPAILRTSTLWSAPPEMGAAWGAFGAIFTAIAVAHTLYAPREVVLWNWRRILLLGLSLALAMGCEFVLVILAPIALALMLYVAHTRRAAALAIWAAASIVALLLLWAAYSFHFSILWQALRHARFGFAWQALGMAGAYRKGLAQLVQAGPSVLLILPVALMTYVSWRRTRYFGNTAPLVVAVGAFVLGVASPHASGDAFRLIALPFLFVFVAGIVADLLETRHRSVVAAFVAGLLVANALWNLMELARVGRG